MGLPVRLGRCFAVVPVLFTGGLTTSNQAGLAVPDWPNTRHQHVSLPRRVHDRRQFYEHTHRLFGSPVSLPSAFFCTR